MKSPHKTSATDQRAIKLKEYRGLREHDVHPTREKPLYAPFFGDNEPTWMSRIDGEIRLRIYEDVIHMDSKEIHNPIGFFKEVCILKGMLAMVLLVITSVPLLPTFPRTLLALASVSYAAAMRYCYCKGVKEEEEFEVKRRELIKENKVRVKERIEQYKDKSMEYILTEAHTLKVGSYFNQYTPTPTTLG